MMVIRLALGAMLLTTTAHAHSFYPKECCSDYDCAPADQVTMVGDGFLAVTSVHGTTLVHASFPRRESVDHRLHICMTRDYLNGGMKPLCIFIPPTN